MPKPVFSCFGTRTLELPYFERIADRFRTDSARFFHICPGRFGLIFKTTGAFYFRPIAQKSPTKFDTHEGGYHYDRRSFLPDANNSGNYVSRIGTMRLEVFSMTHRTWSCLRNFSHQTNYNYFVFLTIVQYFYGQNCYDVISQMIKHSWVRRFTR